MNDDFDDDDVLSTLAMSRALSLIAAPPPRQSAIADGATPSESADAASVCVKLKRERTCVNLNIAQWGEEPAEAVGGVRGKAIRTAAGARIQTTWYDYLAVACFATCLLLAALVGWRYSPSKLAAARRGAAHAAGESPPRYSFLKVEDATPGQRIISRNPDMAEAGGASRVNPRTWRLVHLRQQNRWADGTLDVMEVKTLQDPEWLIENDARVGRLVPVPLDLVEMGMPPDMKAEVTAIEPCPPIEDGPGQVILTTVTRLSNDLYELTLENEAGKRETIHPTGRHPLRRADGEWIAASELRPGDQISSIRGVLRLLSTSKLAGTDRVYNITVENQHVYFVGEFGALAHNNGCGDLIYRALSEEDLAALAAGRRILPKGVAKSVVDHVAGDPTKWISASMTYAGTARFRGPAGVAVIDVRKLLETGSGLMHHKNVVRALRDARQIENATSAAEVLIKGGIDPSAIVRIIPFE